MAKAWNQTRVSEILGLEYPIIQGPLGGLSSQRLTAAASNFGGLGSFGAHGLEPNAIEDVIILKAARLVRCKFRLCAAGRFDGRERPHTGDTIKGASGIFGNPTRAS
jgi:hypothetical protein